MRWNYWVFINPGLDFIAALLRFSSSLAWNILRSERRHGLQAWELRPVMLYRQTWSSFSNVQPGHSCLGSEGILFPLWALASPLCQLLSSLSEHLICFRQILWVLLLSFQASVGTLSCHSDTHRDYHSVGKKAAMNSLLPTKGFSFSKT